MKRRKKRRVARLKISLAHPLIAFSSKAILGYKSYSGPMCQNERKEKCRVGAS